MDAVATESSQHAFRYQAFISYSHRDRAWAEWLHRRLESYRVPRRLVGREGPCGPAPARLFPVFRDADELPSSPNLSASIDAALRDSRALILIASPYAAVSRWVDQEIRRFRALGRGHRIFCLIVDGEPHADRQPDKGQLECFPPALREDPDFEPIAADARPGQDSRSLASLRLIAGWLGVGFDELRRRERRRARMQRALAAGLAFVGVAALFAVWHTQQAQKREALAQQARETRIARLYEGGRQEFAAHNEARAAVLLNTAYGLGLDTPALRFMLGRAMRVVEAQQSSFSIGAPVAGLAFSPDGARLATVDANGKPSLWDVGRGSKLLDLQVAGGKPLGVPRFCASGRRLSLHLANAKSENSTLAVFDTGDGHPLVQLDIRQRSWRAQTAFDAAGDRIAFIDPQGRATIYDLDAAKAHLLLGAANAVGFSRNGHLLLTGGADGLVVERDPVDGRILHTLEGLHAPVAYIDTSPDGALIAAGAEDGSFRLWDSASGEQRLSGAHTGRYVGHVFSDLDGSRLLTASSDSARVWDTRSGALLYAQKFGSNQQRIHLSQDGRRVVNTGSARLAVIDIESGTELFSLDGHAGSVADVDFASGDRLFATGGSDGRVVIWKLPPAPLADFAHGIGRENPADPASQQLSARAAFDPDGTRLLSTGADGLAILHDAGTMSETWRIPAPHAPVTAAVFDREGERLALGGAGWVSVRTADGAAEGLSRVDLERVVTRLAFSPDGRWLMLALRGGLTRVLALADGAEVAAFERDYTPAQAFDPSGAHFAVGMHGAVKLWDLTTRRFLWSAAIDAQPADEPSVHALAFDGDGLRLLAAGGQGRLVLLDAKDGRVLSHLQDSSSSFIGDAQLTRDGSTALYADDNRCVALWHIASGVNPHLCGHGAEVQAARFIDDETLIVSAGNDGQIIVWDATEARALETVGQHGGRLSGPLEFDPVRERLLTTATDGRVRLWDLRRELRRPGELATILRCRVPWQVEGSALVSVPIADASCSTDTSH